jgi:hypothetical protein
VIHTCSGGSQRSSRDHLGPFTQLSGRLEAEVPVSGCAGALALLLSPSVGSADLDTVARQGGGLLPEWVDEGWVLGAPSFKAPIEDLIYGTIY